MQRSLFATTTVNLGMTAISAVTGAILARALGPDARGVYAAVTAWFWVALVVTEVGQTAAVTFYVSRDRENASAYIATSQRITTGLGIVVLVVGWLAAPLLGQGDPEAVAGYRIMAVACLATLSTCAHSSSLQSLNVMRWNIVRAAQPLLYLVAVVTLVVLGSLDLRAAILALAVTVAIQAAVGYALVRRLGLARGRAQRSLARPLVRYGSSQLLASGPALANTRLDQLVLSQTVSASQLGFYSVAVTVSSLVVPTVAAIGNLAFPRLASIRRDRAAHAGLVRRSITATILLATVSALILAGTAEWTVPLVFGESFEESVPLVWILAPGAVFLACGQVVGDLLRGGGRPLSVALGQGIGAVVTLVLLALLIPTYGVTGAAWASSIAYAVTFGALALLIARSLRGVPAEPGASA